MFKISLTFHFEMNTSIFELKDFVLLLMQNSLDRLPNRTD